MNENSPTLDLTFLNEFCRGDKKKMAAYIRTFLETAPGEIQCIHDAVSALEWGKVTQHAHSLRPQATFIGIPALQLLTERLESESGGNQPEVSVPPLDAQLDAAMNEGIDALVQTLVALS
jgi:HPt (histidine-containing phosphotransfer) domain-containing protein